jgi:hypothetical protein
LKTRLVFYWTKRKKLKSFAFPIVMLRFTYPSSVFHLLDSLSTSNPAVPEVNQLQKIFLQYFDQEYFKEGRIALNVAQVSHHPSFCSI